MLSNTTFAELEENYYTQAKYLVEGGVDVLLVETAQDILEMKAAVAGFERLFAEIGRRVAVQAQVTLDTSGRMLLGTDIASAMTTLEALRVDVIGLNCSTGPEHMREPIRYLASTRACRSRASRTRACRSTPAPATPSIRSSPRRWRRCSASSSSDFGVRIVGGCCGTTPEHLAAIVKRVSHRDARVRSARRAHGARSGPARVVRHARDHDFDQNPRTAAHRRARECAGLAQGEAPAARRGLRGISTSRASRWSAGAHVLDVCVARHRARRRSGADVEGREAAVDDGRDADHDRLHRGER